MVVSPDGEEGNSDAEIGSDRADLAVIHHFKFCVLPLVNEEIRGVKVRSVLVAGVVPGRVAVGGMAELVRERVDTVTWSECGAQDDEFLVWEPAAEVSWACLLYTSDAADE